MEGLHKSSILNTAIEQYLIRRFKFVDRLNLPFEKGLSKELRLAQRDLSGKEWFRYCFGLFSISFVLVFFLLLMLFETFYSSLLLAPLFSLFFSVCVFLVAITQPSRERKRYAESFEADMALGLLLFSIYLESGVRFKYALGKIKEGFGVFSDSVRRIMEKEALGESITKCLEQLSDSVGSIYVKRAANGMKNAYRFGGGSLALLAEDLLKNNENKLKEYSSKSGFMTQASTVITVVFPTLLVSLLIVAAIISKPSTSPFLLSVGIGFGVSLFAVLLYRYQLSSLPAFVKSLYGREPVRFSAEGIDKKLGILGYDEDSFSYLCKVGVLSSAFLFLSIICLLYASFAVFLVLVFISFFSLFVGLFYPELRYNELKKEVEDSMPFVLEQAAQLSGKRIDEIIENISKLGCGRISKEFGKIKREIDSGGSVESGIKKFCEEMGSGLIEKGMSLLLEAHKTGIDMKKALKETSKYIQRIKFIMQESRAATYSERLTQIFGFLISAALFGIVVSMGEGLANLLTGGLMAVDLGTLRAVVLGVRMNLLIQPFVISYSVSSLENDKKKFFFYLPMLLIGGNVLFMVAQMIRVI